MSDLRPGYDPQTTSAASAMHVTQYRPVVNSLARGDSRNQSAAASGSLLTGTASPGAL